MTCEIIITNKSHAEGEAIVAALTKANQYIPTSRRITIYCSPRRCNMGKSDWLEYGISIEFDSGSKLYLAMIQRSLDAEFEFHS
jgi:hypothetical protein